MPKRAKERSPAEVRRMKRPRLYAVGGVAGLHLQVQHEQARSWILRLKVGDRRRDFGLGPFPEVTLEQARNRAREYKDALLNGKDPVAERRAARAALLAEQAKRLTFEEAAKEFHRIKSLELSNAKHIKDWISSLERYAFPVLGKLPVASIERVHIINALKPIWTTKTETASRVRQRIEAVLAWATVSGYRSGENPARWSENLEYVLPRPSKIYKSGNFAALPWQELPAFMGALKEREGMGARALEFAILTAARSGEVRLATWDEIDFGAKLWTVPAERMKGRKVHRVPLSDAAIKLLKALPRFEGSPYVFPAARGGALSDMSVNAVTRRMGVNAVPHGFRSTFKDWCRSCTNYPDEVSELALAHVSSDATRAAYARDELLPKRTRLMRDWARFCYGPARRGEVVPMRGKRA